MSVKAPGKGNSAKHTGTRKHAAKRKHTAVHHRAAATAHGAKAHAVAKHPSHPKPRGFAVGDLLPVCSFEALAMSLRLAGQLVDDDEVAWLWELAGADPLGATLPAALDAARLHGLAGLRPRWKKIAAPVAADHLALPFTEDQAVPVDPFEDFLASDLHGLLGLAGCVPVVAQAGHRAAVGHAAVDDLLNERVFCDLGNDLAELSRGGRVGERLQGRDAAQFQPFVNVVRGSLEVHGLILGIDAPGPHCVLATAGGWWSWGELHDPWAARIEEAWVLSWTDEKSARGLSRSCPPARDGIGPARVAAGSLAGDTP